MFSVTDLPKAYAADSSGAGCIFSLCAIYLVFPLFSDTNRAKPPLSVRTGEKEPSLFGKGTVSGEPCKNFQAVAERKEPQLS